jgi:hypothetical protein
MSASVPHGGTTLRYHRRRRLATGVTLVLAGASLTPALQTHSLEPSQARRVLAGLEDWLAGTRDLQGRFTQSLISGALGADVQETGRL